ncbi:MAG: serine hydrolase domain-containing protein, partial [Planctomycetota bacterium]
WSDRPKRTLGRRSRRSARREFASAGRSKEKRPGFAIMVVRDGVVVHARGYGHANLEADEPITRTTPFRLASVTKQFTCMAILTLVAEGEIALDDPAMKYVPSLERFGPQVTIRRLMQHTSGLPEYYSELNRLEFDLPSADDDPLLTHRDATEIFRTWGEVQFVPGSQYVYSNPAYEQLALIVENVTGDTFGEYLEDEVLDPAGMPTAIVRDRPEVEIPGRAIGYIQVPAGYHEFDDHPGNWMVGAGGLYASLDDLYFWDRALDEGTLLPEGLQAEAYQPAVLSDGSVSEYGFGWALEESLDRRCHSHGGAWVGFRTSIARYPDDRVTIMVLSNLGRIPAGRISEDIARAVFGVERPKPSTE